MIVKCQPRHFHRFSDPVWIEEHQFVYSPAAPSCQNMVSFDSKAIGDITVVYTLQYLQIPWTKVGVLLASLLFLIVFAATLLQTFPAVVTWWMFHWRWSALTSLSPPVTANWQTITSCLFWAPLDALSWQSKLHLKPRGCCNIHNNVSCDILLILCEKDAMNSLLRSKKQKVCYGICWREDANFYYD